MTKLLIALASSSLIFGSLASAQQDYSEDTTNESSSYETETTDSNYGVRSTTTGDNAAAATAEDTATAATTDESQREVSVTQADGLVTRKDTEAFNFFRFGPTTMMNIDAAGAGVYLSAGRLYTTHPQAAIRVSANTAFSGADGGGTSSFLSASLGGTYFLDQSDTAPHAFADLGYGYADAPDLNSTNGFTLGVGVGTAFFRSTDMQMDVSARYQLMMSSNEDGAPGMLALLLGLNFG